MPIVQGDNGRIIEDTFPEPLTGATIEIVIKAGSRTILKAGEIVDAAAGTYKFTLTNSDLAKSGYYMYQTTATYSDGRIFSNEPQRFIVSGKIIVDISDPGNVIEEGTNGKLLVNGVELTVYDDTAIKSDIEALQNGGGGGSVPSNVILFEDWIGGESVTIDTGTTPPADTTAPVITASLSAGTYNSAQTVSLSSNETATIYYTTNGSTPTEASAVYSSPINISATTTLKFFGKDSAGNVSAVQSVTYTIDISTPDTTAPTVTASPNGGTFSGTQQVTLSANETATIYYTLDNSTPTTSSAVYSSPITLSATTTLKFFGRDAAGNNSAVQSVTFTYQAPADTTAPTVTANPVGGTFTSGQIVTLSANETATIYYTTDGSTPTESSSVYSAAIGIDATTTLKYFAKDTAGNVSVVQTQVYTINAQSSSWVTNGLVNKWDNIVNTMTLTDDPVYIPPTGDFTIVATIKPKAYAILFRQWDGNAGVNSIKLDQSATIGAINGTLYGADSTFPTINTTSVMTDATQYYHVVFMRDGTGFKWFINNTANNSLAKANTWALHDSTKSITIGASGSDYKNVLYYNRALTTEELTQNYNALK